MSSRTNSTIFWIFGKPFNISNTGLGWIKVWMWFSFTKIILPVEIDSYIAYVKALSQKCIADLMSEEIVPTILLINLNESLLNNSVNLESLAFKIF